MKHALLILLLVCSAFVSAARADGPPAESKEPEKLNYGTPPPGPLPLSPPPRTSTSSDKFPLPIVIGIFFTAYLVLIRIRYHHLAKRSLRKRNPEDFNP